MHPEDLFSNNSVFAEHKLRHFKVNTESIRKLFLIFHTAVLFSRNSGSNELGNLSQIQLQSEVIVEVLIKETCKIVQWPETVLF